MCIAGDADGRFTCVTLGSRKVQLGWVKCVTLTRGNVTRMRFKCVCALASMATWMFF
jgi:hypothetical protein